MWRYLGLLVASAGCWGIGFASNEYRHSVKRSGECEELDATAQQLTRKLQAIVESNTEYGSWEIMAPNGKASRYVIVDAQDEAADKNVERIVLLIAHMTADKSVVVNVSTNISETQRWLLQKKPMNIVFNVLQRND